MIIAAGLVDKNNLLDENAMPGPHDLRHYYASQAIRAGAALEDLTEQLGHDSIAVTLSHYYHLLGDKRDRVLKMAALIDSFNA